MPTAMFHLYLNHDPSDRAKAKAIESDDGDSWVLIQEATGTVPVLNFGLLPHQARDLARQLFATAAEAEAIDAEIAAKQPRVAQA